MISEKEIANFIEAHDCIHLRCFDRTGRRILDIDAKSAKEAANELASYAPMIKSYGIIDIKGANAQCYKANFSGAYQWRVNYGTDGTMGTHTQNHQGNSMLEMVQTMVAMKNFMGGDNNNAVLQQQLLDSKLAQFKAENTGNLEYYKLVMNNPMTYLPQLLPIGMSIMGKSNEDIKDTMTMMALGNKMNGTPGSMMGMGMNMPQMPGMPGMLMPGVYNSQNQNTSVQQSNFQELHKKTQEEKTKILQEKIDALAGKLSQEQMIMLCEIMTRRPELADKTIEAANSGLI